MNIAFLVNYDVAASLALNLLLPRLDQHQISIFYTRKPSVGEPPLDYLVLAQFEQRLLSALDSNAGNRCIGITRLAAQRGLHCEMANQINDRDLGKVKSQQPDLIVSIRHMTILREAVISLPQYGVINLHSGLLPNYQGVMATFWAMLAREPEIGTSLHFIQDATIDTGSIIKLSKQRTDYTRSYFYNLLNLYPAGCSAIIEAIADLSAGMHLESQPQQGEAQYFSFPQQEDYTAFANNLAVPLCESGDATLLEDLI